MFCKLCKHLAYIFSLIFPRVAHAADLGASLRTPPIFQKVKIHHDDFWA